MEKMCETLLLLRTKYKFNGYIHVKTKPAYGNSTETAIRSGVIRGIEHEINGYIQHLKKNYPSLLVFLTGGNDFSFDTNLKSGIFADGFLVLKGLNRILDYNDII